MNRISVVVITHNEEQNIRRCLDSVKKIADEIVVVDSYSTDFTCEIARAMGARVLLNEFVNHIDQKNYALSQAKFDRVLSLDADEYLSDTLAESMLHAKNNWRHDAYRMNRRSSYGAKWVWHGNWYPDAKIRLWDRRKGKWGGENPHDKVIMQRRARVKKLRGDLLHRAYKGVADTIEKIQRYSEISSNAMFEKRQKTSTLIIFFKIAFSFFKSYVLKRGVLDGFEGLMVALAVANHAAYKYAKLYERTRWHSLGKRIIIGRSDNLGDVTVTLPMAGYIKKHFPDVALYFMGKPYTEGLIKLCQHIDGYINAEEILKNPALLATYEADTILFVYPDRRMAQIAKAARIRNRVATSHRWYNWLYCNRLVHFTRYNSDLHEAVLNFNLLKPFGLGYHVEQDELQGYYGIRPVPSQKADKLLDAHRINFVLHPKLKSGMEWPLAKFREVAEKLPPERYQIIVTGLSAERESILAEMPDFFSLPHIVDTMGQLSVDETAYLLSRADGLLAASTGVLHIAASTGTFCLGLFSPRHTIHPNRWMPLGKHARHLVSEKKCDDCKKKTRCACLEEIPVQKVLDEIAKNIAVAKESAEAVR